MLDLGQKLTLESFQNLVGGNFFDRFLMTTSKTQLDI